MINSEVSVSDGAIKVHRIVAAIDRGQPVSPDGSAAQIEGGVVYGLTATLHGEITTESGAVQQSKLSRLPAAAHQRHAGHRSAHHPERGAAGRSG